MAEKTVNTTEKQIPKANTNSSTTKHKHISAQLLRVVIPLVAAGLVILTVFIAISAKNVIEDEATNGLHQESLANANDISSQVEAIKKYYDGTADVLEASPYVTDADILKALDPGMSEYAGMVSDSYIALGRDAFYDGSGWVPDADYDPTTRGWYQNGLNNSSMGFGSPSIDLTTGAMVVCGSRKINMLDGRSGVMSIDVVLASISQTVGEYRPAGTGYSMLWGGGVLIGHVNSDYVGKAASDLSGDSFIQAVASAVDSGARDVRIIKGTDNEDYYVSFDAVAGTNWTLVSYVKRDDVLARLTQFITVSSILAVIMVVVIGIFLYVIVNRLITRPVTALTDNIIRIAGGDFSVEINPGSNDNEIGVMNRTMGEYVRNMRRSMGDMKNIT